MPTRINFPVYRSGTTSVPTAMRPGWLRCSNPVGRSPNSPHAMHARGAAVGPLRDRALSIRDPARGIPLDTRRKARSTAALLLDWFASCA
jgi:hypothetical protein